MNKLFIFMLSALLILSCSNEKKSQEQWIESNLPTMVWYDITYDAVNSEYQRLASSLADLYEETVTSYAYDGMSEYYGNSLESEFLRAINELGVFMGNESYEKQMERKVKNYEKHFTEVAENLLDNFGYYLNLRDSTLVSDGTAKSDNEIYCKLMGTPDKIAKLTSDEEKSIVREIVVNTLLHLSRPYITFIEYDKELELWFVRMDNAEPQYVKFYPRNDGVYDVEYSSELNELGEPISENKISVSIY